MIIKAYIKLQSRKVYLQNEEAYTFGRKIVFCQLLCFWQASQPVSFRDSTIGAKQSNSNKANQDRAEAVSFFLYCVLLKQQHVY